MIPISSSKLNRKLASKPFLNEGECLLQIILNFIIENIIQLFLVKINTFLIQRTTCQKVYRLSFSWHNTWSFFSRNTLLLADERRLPEKFEEYNEHYWSGNTSKQKRHIEIGYCRKKCRRE